MIPRGPVYRKLRSRTLSVMPDDICVPLDRHMNLVDWLQSGHFHVTQLTASEWAIECSPKDLMTSVLGDVEHLLNHIAEHIQEIRCFVGDNRPRSQAWGIVTTYYFSFFSAQALLMMLGSPVFLF